MKWMCSPKLTGLALSALIIGQMLTIAVIPTMVFQPLNIHLSKQGLPVGVIVSIYSMITLAFGLFSGRVVDQYGSERILLVFIPLLAGVYLLYQFANSFQELVAVRVLNGILFAFVVNGFVVLVRKKVLSSSHKTQARVHGIINSLNTVGSGIAMYFGMLLVDDLALLWFSTLVIGWMVVILVYWGIFASSFTQMTIQQLLKKSFASAFGFTRSLFVKQAFFAALPDVGMSSAYWAFLTYFALYKQQEADVILLICTMVYAVAATSVMPILVTKHNKMVVGWSISICVLALILISMAGSFWLLLTAGVLIGIALAGSNLGILERVNHSVDKRRLGGANATASFLRQLGAIIGPSYAGLMWSALGKANMWLALIPMLLASLLFLLIKQGNQEKTAVELILARKRMRAFFYAQTEFKSTLSAYYLPDTARSINRLQTGEEEVRPLEEGDEEEVLAWRVKHYCHALIALKSVQGFEGLSLEKEIRQVEEMLYGLLNQIETCHLHRYYNSIMGWWGTEKSFLVNKNSFYGEDLYLGPEGQAYWIPEDNAEKISVSLERMIEDRVKPAESLVEVQCHLSAVQALELIDLRSAFEKCGVEDNWNTALQMAEA
jgi:MFS family permease